MMFHGPSSCAQCRLLQITQFQTVKNSALGANHHHHQKIRMQLQHKIILRGERHPFEMVKRGGAEGGTALEDINQQMRMSPAKPIPHPVRDRVGVPCISDRGFGISGKAVVALTRIHTQGTGSITIVRTKG